MQNISIIKPIFTFIKNNKTLAKIINWVLLYAFWRSSFKVFRFIGIIFNLFLIILFLDYKNLDLGFSMLASLFLSIISIFPDTIQDYFISIFPKQKVMLLIFIIS
jgi:hypothetical protein